MPLTAQGLNTVLRQGQPEDAVQDVLRTANAKLGGSQDVDHLTPFWWFTTHFPDGDLITDYPLPDMVEQAIEMLELDSERFEDMVESFDLQLDGMGSGEEVCRHLMWCTTLPSDGLMAQLNDFIDPTLAAPSAVTDAAVAVQTLAKALLDNTPPSKYKHFLAPVWYYRRLLIGYLLDSSNTLDTMPPEFLAQVAEKHPYYIDVTAGIPGSCALHPDLLRTLVDCQPLDYAPTIAHV